MAHSTKLINCIVIEDEPLAQEKLVGFIKKTPILRLISVFDNPIKAMQFLRIEKVDLIFLDINLGDISGLDVLESTSFAGKVIITTAYQEYAVKSFEINVLDYLLKPFNYARFHKSIERLEAPKEFNSEFILIPSENRLEKITISDILYIEGMRDYRRIHTKDKRIMTLQTFQFLETQFPSARICRIHKSYMVGIEHIDSIEKEGVRIKEIFLPVSDTYKRNFMALLGK